mgnify:CR=1 FL=1
MLFLGNRTPMSNNLIRNILFQFYIEEGLLWKMK